MCVSGSSSCQARCPRGCFARRPRWRAARAFAAVVEWISFRKRRRSGQQRPERSSELFLLAWSLLFRAEESVAQNEQNREHPDERTDFAVPSAADLHKRER